MFRLLLFLGACEHTYIIRHDEYRRFQDAPSTEIAAERTEDGDAVWLDPGKIHVDKTSDWAVFAHGKPTRATAISGGVVLAAGLVTTIAGGLTWAHAASRCSGGGDFLSHLCSYPSPETMTIFGLGVTATITGALVLGIGELARSEERYRLPERTSSE
jgi:hypothetical protein